MVAQAAGTGETWICTGVYSGMTETFINSLEDVVTQHCEYTKCHWTVNFKTVNFMFVNVTTILIFKI